MILFMAMPTEEGIMKNKGPQGMGKS